MQKITKFSVGNFTNGLYVVRGVIVEGVLSGVITKTNYPELYKKGTYVEVLEFTNKNDEVPHFIKVNNLFVVLEKLIYKKYFKHRTKTGYHFVREVSNTPKIAWNYTKVIDSNNRCVLIEKYNNKSIELNYARLTPDLELKLINIICEKYKSHDILNEFYVAKEKKDRTIKMFEKTCTIRVETVHNKSIFFDLNFSEYLDSIFQAVVFITESENKNEIN